MSKDTTEKLIEEQKSYAMDIAETLNSFGIDDGDVSTEMVLDALAICGYQILPAVSENIASLAYMSMLGIPTTTLDNEGWKG